MNYTKHITKRVTTNYQFQNTLNTRFQAWRVRLSKSQINQKTFHNLQLHLAYYILQEDEYRNKYIIEMRAISIENT